MDNSNDQAGGWTRYEKLVLSTLQELRDDVALLRTDLVLVRIDVAKLKVKSGIWGGVAGFVPGAVGVAAVLLGFGG